MGIIRFLEISLEVWKFNIYVRNILSCQEPHIFTCEISLVLPYMDDVITTYNWCIWLNWKHLTPDNSTSWIISMHYYSEYGIAQRQRCCCSRSIKHVTFKLIMQLVVTCAKSRNSMLHAWNFTIKHWVQKWPNLYKSPNRIECYTLNRK